MVRGIMKRAGVIVVLALAFCGLADSAYITQHEASGTPLLCNIQNLSGCNTVSHSPYSHLFGVPVAEYGLLFYGILFALAALELVVADRFLRRVLQSAALLGLVGSLYFTFLQIFVINALCVYCLGSALVVLFIVVAAVRIEPLRTSPALENKDE